MVGDNELTLEEVLKMEKELSTLDNGVGRLFGNLADVDELDETDMTVQRDQMLAEMKRYEEEEGAWKRDAKKWTVTINAALISEHCIDPAKLKTMTEDERIEEILNVKQVRLDGVGLETIDNLEIVSNATHLYLQNNKIAVLPDEFDWLTKLTHLNLAHNQLEKIEHLTVLSTLVHLDVSYNRLKSLEVEELPGMLASFDYRGNVALETEEDEDQYLLSPLKASLRVCLVYLTKLNGDDLAPAVDDGGADGGSPHDRSAVDDDDENPTRPTASSSSQRPMSAEGSGSAAGIASSMMNDMGEIEAGFQTEVNAIRAKLLVDYTKRRAERDRMLEHIINADVEDTGAADIDAYLAMDKQRRAENASGDASFDVCGSIHEAVMHHKNVSTADLSDQLDGYRKDVARKKEAIMERSKARREQRAAHESETLVAARKKLAAKQQQQQPRAMAGKQ